MRVDTPRPCADCKQDRTPEPIRIAVDYDGRITWNAADVSRAQLDARLAVEARRAIQPEIQIAPNRIARYGDVAHVMAAVQRHKLQRMGIVGGT